MAQNRRTHLRLVAENRSELWVSIGIGILGVLFTGVPIGFVECLIIAGAMVAGFFCALNAILDYDEMGVIEIYFAWIWFLLLLIMTPLTLYWVGSIHEFSNR